MAHINRLTVVSRIARTHNSIAWGKNASALIFAALLIVCSITVGCSTKDKPQPVTSNQAPISPTVNPAPITDQQAALPSPQPAKPVAKKVVRKRPATVTYADKTYGVSFQYPRKYALETGDAANELVASSPLPMNFTQPGGIALAAVALPETSYPGTDFDSAFFTVSLNRSLTAEQCAVFSVPQVNPGPAADSASISEVKTSKLMVGDLELQSAENASIEGSRQSNAKYFHAFQNGSCYEFALKVATAVPETGAGTKRVDTGKVFQRLEKILATVKISATAVPEVAASVPKEPAKELAKEPAKEPNTPETPAQKP